MAQLADAICRLMHDASAKTTSSSLTPVAMRSGIAAKKLPSLGAASLAGLALQDALTACQKGLGGASTTKSLSERGSLSRFHLQLPHRFPLPITMSTQADTSQGSSFPSSPAQATSSDSATGVVHLHDGYGVRTATDERWCLTPSSHTGASDQSRDDSSTSYSIQSNLRNDGIE